METAKVRTEEQVLEDKIENLIAIGAAMAANCVPVDLNSTSEMSSFAILSQVNT